MAKKDWVGTPAEPYWMNPEKCRELVEEHGVHRKAAAAIGVNKGTFWNWLDGGEYKRRYHEDNREARAETNRKYRRENREAISEQRARYREENREALLERNRNYYKEERRAILKQKSEYYKKNRYTIIEKSKNRYRTDDAYWFRQQIHSARHNRSVREADA